MTNATDALRLYKLLADKALNTVAGVPAAHNTLFRPTRASITYYQTLYLDQIGSGHPPRKRPGDATCQYCVPFHLGNLKTIDKRSDIAFSKGLERCFQEFIEDQLNVQGAAVTCQRADQQDLHMPDFKIVRNGDQEVLTYFEFKVIFRPFLKIANQVNPSFECYSNSLTLDLSNGNKLQEQRDRVEQLLGVANTIYVYWYDLPCVKGVFWMPASRVYEVMDIQQGTAYDRRNVAGDFNTFGRKNAATKKLYLPLLEMSDLQSLLEFVLQRSQ
jgi:hypothetical protein